MVTDVLVPDVPAFEVRTEVGEAALASPEIDWSCTDQHPDPTERQSHKVTSYWVGLRDQTVRGTLEISRSIPEEAWD